MNTIVQPLDKNPTLDPSQDFYALRRDGIGFIQASGSDHWTDYNVHDPGITILEALCFAITDLGYRIDWRIEDLLAPKTPPANLSQPYPNQAFFSAREILTVNPTTAKDFRRVLVDSFGVRDAWVVCKNCACEVSYWAFCDLAGQLVLQYGAPKDPPNPAKEAWALGLYEILLELDDDADLGDLNDRMITANSVIHDGGGAHPVIMELRFPDVSLIERDQWRLFLDSGAVFADPNAFRIDLLRLGATKTFNVFDLPTDAAKNDYIRSQWNNVFYVSLRITLIASAKTIDVANAALRVFGDSAVRNATTAATWPPLLTDTSAGGFVARYQRKASTTHGIVASAKAVLQAHRNIDEDYCRVAGVGVEDVAVCADVEVKPDADINRIQAEIWFRIEAYMSPQVRFRTLQELQSDGVAVEDIFDGPALDNGFIEDADLDAAGLKTMLRGSDIINRLMGIDGVIAVNQLRMTKYDSEGNEVAGAADPIWTSEPPVQPVYDPNKISAAWLLAISPRHQPRLYLNGSRFLFYKNGLAFPPQMDEATDTLNQLLGAAERLKTPSAVKDLPVPPGVYKTPNDYYPVQYSFPLAYGIGPAGLPSDAPPLRQAQARDLKAYLMLFEQLLGNALAQLAHTADLFSLDPTIAQTYFVKAFDDTIITGFNDIMNGPPSAIVLQALVETLPEFQARRNTFLDHLLARFGEQFNDYALLLTNIAGSAVAQPRLIASKIAFLRRYPLASHDRAKAFNYQLLPNAPDNDPGIRRRIGLLLGNPDLAFGWTAGPPAAGNYPVAYSLTDGARQHWLDGSITVAAATEAGAAQAAYDLLLERMTVPGAYVVTAGAGGIFTLSLHDASGAEIGHSPQSFAAKADAAAMSDVLLSWSASARMIVVEHLLLRPKFIGDALYPACCDGGCATCGDEDPYSFRLTYVMPGWTAQYTANLELRGYADRTIRQETPSHLLAKICWVGNDGFVENPCDDVVDRLATLLVAEGKTASNAPPTQDDACSCANAVYHAFSVAFSAWFAEKKFAFLHADALAPLIDAQLATVPMIVGGPCTTVFDAALWGKVRAVMTSYFVDIALYGWQFERFEWAWSQWLDANAPFDWTEELLVERVEAILNAGLQTAGVKPAQLCVCARQIVTDYGTAFYAWMRSNIAAGNAVDKLTAFPQPAVGLCPGLTFAAGTQQAIAALLGERYGAYAKPSYWLWAVVTLLANLRNIYPGATLHDCDVIGDQNPVRLGSTALGNYPRRPTL